MHIESLRWVATEGDLNELAARFLPQPEKISGVRIAVVPQGIRITGAYQAAIRIPFETLWEISVCEGKLAVRLRTLKTGILSLGLAHGYVLKAVAATARMLELRGDMLLLDVDALLRERGLPLRTNLASVHCDYGSLIVLSSV
jgi:hypothetical protein